MVLFDTFSSISYKAENITVLKLENIFEIFYQGSPPCLEVRNFRISEAGILFLQVSSLSRGGIRTKIEKSCWPRFSSFIIFYKCLPSLEVGWRKLGSACSSLVRGTKIAENYKCLPSLEVGWRKLESARSSLVRGTKIAENIFTSVRRFSR